MLTANDILDLWHSGGPFREIAAEEIVKDFPAHAGLFFDLLDSDTEGILRRHAKGGMPFLNDTYRQPARGADSPCSTFDDFRLQEQTFMHTLNDRVAAMGATGEAYRSRIESIFPEIAHRTPDNTDGLRQLMVFVTGRCNLQCPYCFSSDIEQTYISLPDLRRIFEWARRQGVRKITPCGGEPLIYNHFSEFIDEAERSGMATYFASNLTIPIGRLHGLRAPLLEKVYAHLTAQTLASPGLLNTFTENMQLLRRRGVEVIGRVNLTSPDASSLDAALKHFADNGINRVNIALTIPSTNATNSFTAIDMFDSRIPALCQVIHRAQALGIEAGVSKPLPICRMPSDMVTGMLTPSVGAGRCEIDSDNFMHNLSLSPAMKFSPCLGLENVVMDFRDDITWDEIEQTFAPYVRGLMAKPLYPECPDCYLYRSRLCQGSCLSYKA